MVIDLGLPLDAEGDPIEYLPEIAGLDGGDPSLLGVLVSHPHLDHFGLLSRIYSKIPVGMGEAARRILRAASPFMQVDCGISEEGWNFHSCEKFKVGPFVVIPFLVDHSAYDSYALLIESDEKRVFYSGDFRLHGRKKKFFRQLSCTSIKHIDVLFLEGTLLGCIGTSRDLPSEKEIEDQMVHKFLKTDGLVLVHASAQNIDRIVSIFRACKRTGRRLVIDLYTAAVLEATGNENIPQSFWKGIHLYIPQMQRVLIKKKGLFELLNRHSANRIYIEEIGRRYDEITLLFRPIHRFDLEREGCLSGSIYIYSQWEGYWERGCYDNLKNWLSGHNIPKYSIHTSGHASPEELKRLVEWVNPERVVPIHSFYPEHYRNLFPNVEVHKDGQWWEV